MPDSSRHKATIDATLRVLGLIASALSVVSFVQSIFQVGLAPTFLAIVTYYRDFADAVVKPLAQLFGVDLPQQLVDFWTISFVGAGAYVRTPNIEQSRALRGYALDPRGTWWKVALFIVFGFFGIGFAITLGVLAPMTYVDEFHEETMDLMKGAAVNVFMVCVAAVVFYAFNAFAPGG